LASLGAGSRSRPFGEHSILSRRDRRVSVGTSPLQTADNTLLRLLSAHATPGTSLGPGTRSAGLALKPWFHTRLAEWISGSQQPFIFAIDANTPAVDTLDWATSRFHIPSDGDARPGEDLLLGPPDRRLHAARKALLHLRRGRVRFALTQQCRSQNPGDVTRVSYSI
jgi:hypothetical protein